MSTREFANAVRQGRERLEAEAPGAFASAALSMLSTIKDRSIQDGLFVDSRPGDTVDYSTRPMLTAKFIGKELNSAGRRYIASNRLGTYKGFREAQGLPSDNVNSSYTNALWRSIVVQNLRKEGSKITVTVTTDDPAQLEKLAYMVGRYGLYYNPVPAEQKTMATDLVNDLINLTLPWLKP